MENASKALLIAGAILIAIVLISLGVMVLGQGSSTIKNAGMTDTEITAYNSEFEAYKGTVRGSKVVQLINSVNEHNRLNASDLSKQIATEINTEAAVNNAVKDTLDFTNESQVVKVDESEINSMSQYKVVLRYSSSGLVSKIYIIKK